MGRRHGKGGIGLSAILVLLPVACQEAERVDPAMAAQLQSLERAQARRRIELAEIRRQIADAQALLEAERRRVEQARCEASRTEIRALASRLAAGCLEQQLQHAQCLASAARSTADSTMVGALLGAAAAVLTGGAAAPFVVGGAMAGRASGDDGRCGVAPSCSSESGDHVAGALRESGLSEAPTCGPEQPPLSDCFFAAPRSFCLRGYESTENIGPQYPERTGLRIEGVGQLVRQDGLRASHVRLHNGQVGWMFLSEEDIRTHRCVEER